MLRLVSEYGLCYYNNSTGVECQDYPNGYRCGPCPPGLTGDGRRGTCQPIKYGCETRPCYPGVECTDTDDGKFICGECPTGYEGNGTVCTDMNEV